MNRSKSTFGDFNRHNRIVFYALHCIVYSVIIVIILLIGAVMASESRSLSQLDATRHQQTQVNQIMQLPPNSIELVHGSNTDVKHAIIWLHGVGATADDFPPIVPELGLDPERSIRFIFPQAPDRPITINGGMRMPGWYDIKGMSLEEKQDAVGMAESKAMVDSLIESLVSKGTPSSNIILAGFSQGGAVTYFTGVRSQHKLAGMLPLSTYLPFQENTVAEHSTVNQTTPIFASHGTQDPVVPLELGQLSVEALRELGYNIKLKTYPMQHQVMMPQIQDIGRWINQVYSD